jgi:hypothetical protein
MSKEPKKDERSYWLDNPRKVDRLMYLFYAACAVLVGIDIFIPKHGPFAIEHYFGFYAVLGFIACAGIILGAKLLRRVLMRPEDYYDR